MIKAAVSNKKVKLHKYEVIQEVLLKLKKPVEFVRSDTEDSKRKKIINL